MRCIGQSMAFVSSLTARSCIAKACSLGRAQHVLIANDSNPRSCVPTHPIETNISKTKNRHPDRFQVQEVGRESIITLSQVTDSVKQIQSKASECLRTFCEVFVVTWRENKRRGMRGTSGGPRDRSRCARFEMNSVTSSLLSSTLLTACPASLLNVPPRSRLELALNHRNSCSEAHTRRSISPTRSPLPGF